MQSKNVRPIRILVDSFADSGWINAQMSNGREIISRLNQELFHVSVFTEKDPDPRITSRSNTQLIWLPRHRQTPHILRQFLFGHFDIIFYVKGSPASKLYFRLRRWIGNRSIAVGSVESRSDLHHEPTVSAAAIRLWQQTTLRCDWLFSNSLAVQRNLLEETGLTSEVIPTGVDSEFFSPSLDPHPETRPQVLFAGSLRPFKEPDILLQAAVNFPGADFTIAGDGPMAPALRQRIMNEKLRNVTLAGSLGAMELRNHYRASDIFLFPSKWEGSPKVILEAAACGLPVIARKNYEPETVLDNRTGFLVASDEELFERLKLLLSRPDLRRQFGDAGRAHARKFDWDRITPQWEDAFLRMASRKAETVTL